MKNIFAYSIVVDKLRAFFKGRGFIEIATQPIWSILAACEDPTTIQQVVFSGINWPLKQTGQMDLEGVLLSNPELVGVCCETTSNRDEMHPIPGRHDLTFQMYEFEARGNMRDLIQLEKDLLVHLGFKPVPVEITYEAAAAHCGVSELEAEHEQVLCDDLGPLIFLTHFPQRTHPFWNMRHIGDGVYNKVDVIAEGMETFGSAERSVDKQEMRDAFFSISNGEYSKLLFSSFTKERVLKELDAYLAHDFFPRFGAGVGINRLVAAMEKQGLV